MKSKTSPGKVSIIDLDKVSSDGLQEGLIVFQLLEMGAPNSSMVKSYGRLKIFESYAGVLSIRKLQYAGVLSRFWSGLVLVVQIRDAHSNQA